MPHLLNKEAQINVITFAEWMALLGDTIRLPIIQRAAVWKPNQIGGLWDSLLRSMPMGALMVYPLAADEPVRAVGSVETVDPGDNQWGLLDGQQRTLAMKLGWSAEPDDAQQRLWIDLHPNKSDLVEANRFRLWLTTLEHPFGFTKEGTRLPLKQRRHAYAAFLLNSPTQANDDRAPKPWPKRMDQTYPYAANCPVPLAALIAVLRDPCFTLESWLATQNVFLKNPNSNSSGEWITAADALKRHKNSNPAQTLAAIAAAIGKLEHYQIPLINKSAYLKEEPVHIKAPVDGQGQSGADEAEEDAVLTLFKRLGSGGTSLTPAEYNFSLIKKALPQAHELVARLHHNQPLSQQMGAAELVNLTLRLSLEEIRFKTLPDGLARNTSDQDKKINDQADFDTKRLRRLLSGTHQLAQAEDFKTTIQDVLNRMPEDFGVLTKAIDCKLNFPGLPRMAFGLIHPELLTVLMRWVLIGLPSDPLAVLRLIWFWLLCKPDHKKASMALMNLPRNELTEQHIYQTLTVQDKRGTVLAHTLPAPQELLDIAFTCRGIDDANFKYPGWWRWREENKPEQQRNASKVYRQFWHQKELLLWLQRDYANRLAENQLAISLDEEVTCYDYDHLIAKNKWSGNESLTHFLTSSSARGEIGNAIGNYQLLNFVENRSAQDASLAEKKGNKTWQEFAAEACIQPVSTQVPHVPQPWRQVLENFQCADQGETAWTLDRLKIWLRAVEGRTFALYAAMYEVLGFAEVARFQRSFDRPEPDRLGGE